MTFFRHIVYLRPCSVIYGSSVKREARKFHPRRTQINQSFSKKCHVVIIIINGAGQMVSRMPVLIIQVNSEFEVTSNHHLTVDSTS